MSKSKLKKFLRIQLAASLICSVSIPSVVLAQSSNVSTLAAAPKESIFRPAALNKVNISKKSYIEMYDLNMIQTDQGKTITFTLSFTNKDNTEINFIDYWIKARNKNGSQYKPVIVQQDKDKKRILANATTTFRFYMNVSDNVKLEDLVFEIIKWDFSASNFEKTIGKIVSPKNYSVDVPVGSKGIIRTSGAKLKANVDGFTVNAIDEHNLLSLNLYLENIGFSAVDNINYKYMLRSKSGLLFPLSTTSIKTDEKLLPQDKKQIQLNALLRKNVSLDQMSLVIAKDEEADKITISLASLMLPKATTDSTVTPINQERILTVDSSSLKTSVKRALNNTNQNSQNVTITFNLNNNGNKSVTVPNYEFAIRTTDGITYPLSTSALNNLIINPRNDKEILLTAKMPKDININNAVLLVYNPKIEDKPDQLRYPIATYKLPDMSKGTPTIGTQYRYTNGNGNYNFELQSIQRLPMNDRDVLAAKIKIKNNSLQTLPMISLDGFFNLDGFKQDSEKSYVIVPENSFNIKPMSEVIVYLVSKVPYTAEYKSISISLQEKQGEDKADITELGTGKANDELKTIGIGDSYIVPEPGRNTSLLINKVKVYKALTTNLVYAELVEQNLEKRNTYLPTLIAYYQTTDGLYLPATITSTEEIVQPEGKVLTAIWVKLPKEYSAGNTKLIIGEAVTDNSFTPVKGVPNYFVNAAQLDIPYADEPVKTDLTDLSIYPYTISINNFEAALAGSTDLKAHFYYTLKRNSDYDFVVKGHKLNIELVDTNTGIAFSKSFSLEEGGDLVLNLGGNTAEYSIATNGAITKDKLFGAYKVNIYDEFEGHKRLLGTKSYYYTLPIN